LIALIYALEAQGAVVQRRLNRAAMNGSAFRWLALALCSMSRWQLACAYEIVRQRG